MAFCSFKGARNGMHRQVVAGEENIAAGGSWTAEMHAMQVQKREKGRRTRRGQGGRILAADRPNDATPRRKLCVGFNRPPRLAP